MCGENVLSEPLDHTSATQKAWEKSFKSKLLESPSDAFDGVKKCSISMTVGSNAAPTKNEVITQDTSKENGTEPISVKVHCKGLSYKKLSLSDDAFSALALQDSYNEVHGSIEGDDNTLSGITFTGTTSATGPATNLRRTDLHQWGQNDGGYSGGHGCRMCGENVLGEPLDHTAAMQKAWEKSFTSKLLLESPSDAFDGVKKCSISMKKASNADAME
jgi:hypothetical protein